VLALAPEELAGQLLILMKQRFPSGVRRFAEFHVGNLIAETMDEVNSPTWGPQAYNTSGAVAEAYGWLIGQGLITPVPGNPSGGMCMLSRRAYAFQTDRDFQRYRAAARLTRDLLHPAIAEPVWLSFIRGEFDTAAFQAMRQVEIAIREATGLDEIGVKLAALAFKPVENGVAGPLADREAEAGEQEGMMQLFRGALAALKNPHSHRVVNFDDPADAASTVIFASQLLRIVDRRAKAR
jgi:uncharacterized protein (TIGR02391 family)